MQRVVDLMINKILVFLNRFFVQQNFRIAKKSGHIFSAYWRYFFVRHYFFILWRVSDEKYFQYAENMFPLFFATRFFYKELLYMEPACRRPNYLRNLYH